METCPEKGTACYQIAKAMAIRTVNNFSLLKMTEKEIIQEAWALNWL